MSQIKNIEEINKIKRACKETDAIFLEIIKHVRQDLRGCSEIVLRDFILEQIKKRGLKPSFPPIVTSGKRAGNDIHPKPSDKKLQGFVIIDFGVIYQKYMSDMTRTIYVACPSLDRGVPSQKEKDLYDLVLSSQNKAIKNSKIGTKVSMVDHECRRDLGKYQKYFIHTLGHGVGTKIHEKPILYFKNLKPTLKENMIITIEPGIYIKNKLGIRIEDTCLVSKKGCIPLTCSNRELIVIQ